MLLEHKDISMEISIETYVEKLLPWDFSVKVGGVVYQTRPLTMGDVLLIEDLEKKKGTVAAMQTMADVVQSLFVAPAPDVATWPFEAFMAVLVAVMTYWKEQTKKNMQAIRLSIEGTPEKS
jgi:hypothetical protein